MLWKWNPPHLGPTRKRLFFRKESHVPFVTVAGAAALFAEIAGIRGFDVIPDGQEVIDIVRPADTGIVRHLSIVTNWFEQLNRVAPAGTTLA